MSLDFSRKRLKNCSFKNQNLTGADFSYSILQGVKFDKALLKQANFSYVQTRLPVSYVLFLLVTSSLPSALAGAVSGLSGVITLLFINQNPLNYFNIFSTTAISLSLLIFIIQVFKKGFLTGLISGVIALIPTLILGFTFSGEVAGIGSSFFIGTAAISLITIGLAAIAWSIVALETLVDFMIVAVITTLSTAVLTADIIPRIESVPATVIVSIFGYYIARRSIAGDEKFSWIRNSAVAFAAIGGTSFRGADLTDANFTQATLKNTDFRGAILTRTCWKHAKKLDCARVGDSILANASVRDLLVGGYGYKKYFAGHNLKGANLAGADLNEVNLKEADLSEATLHGAYLEGANLTKNQSIGTDFTNAHLTGACLESWTIDSTTKLDKVDCRYFYLLEHPNPKTGDRERRPHNPDKVFEPGDFEKLYKKIMNTVQLLLRNGINKEAFTIAFQKLMEENPEITPDSIQAIEKKGNDVLLTLEVPEGTDKGKVQRNFEEIYEARLEAQKQAALLDAEIRHNKDIKEILLATLVNKPSSNPIFNVTNTATAESKSMSDSIDKSRNLSISGMQGDITGNIILGDNANISGAVTKTINQLPDSSEPDKPGIKELLTQLQAAIEAESNLNEEDKAEALEQVKALAEAGKNPQEGAMQKTAKTAMKILKGTVTGLPSAAALVEACNKLLPMIASLLGLA